MHVHHHEHAAGKPEERSLTFRPQTDQRKEDVLLRLTAPVKVLKSLPPFFHSLGKSRGVLHKLICCLLFTLQKGTVYKKKTAQSLSEMTWTCCSRCVHLSVHDLSPRLQADSFLK